MRLTDRQQRLVEANIGLVHVHLSRFVDVRQPPTRSREADDLYQEGLLGLMRAAATFDPDRHGAFAAFALPRIHSAVSQALYEQFSTVRVPAKVQRQAARARSTTEPGEMNQPGRPPTVRALGEYQDQLVARGSGLSVSGDTANGATVGQRLRDVYIAALRAAAAAWLPTQRTRADRQELVERLINDRLLIPEPEHRTTLRQIARDLGSSTSYVRDCEQALLQQIGCVLDTDPEARALQQTARRSEHGYATPIDEALQIRLQRVMHEAFLQRFARLDEVQQGAILIHLVRDAGEDPGEITAEMLTRLSDEQVRRFVLSPPGTWPRETAEPGPRSARSRRKTTSQDPPPDHGESRRDPGNRPARSANTALARERSRS